MKYLKSPSGARCAGLLLALVLTLSPLPGGAAAPAGSTPGPVPACPRPDAAASLPPSLRGGLFFAVSDAGDARPLPHVVIGRVSLEEGGGLRLSLQPDSLPLPGETLELVLPGRLIDELSLSGAGLLEAGLWGLRLRLDLADLTALGSFSSEGALVARMRRLEPDALTTAQARALAPAAPLEFILETAFLWRDARGGETPLYASQLPGAGFELTADFPGLSFLSPPEPLAGVPLLNYQRILGEGGGLYAVSRNE